MRGLEFVREASTRGERTLGDAWVGGVSGENMIEIIQLQLHTGNTVGTDRVELTDTVPVHGSSVVL